MPRPSEADMSTRPEPASGPWRRFLRFSVRGLIVLVLVIGAAIGWLVRSAHIQRDAVAAIRAAGGAVKYDWEWTNGKATPGTCRSPFISTTRV
jgi:hypothetical protein